MGTPNYLSLVALYNLNVQDEINQGLWMDIMEPLHLAQLSICRKRGSRVFCSPPKPRSIGSTVLRFHLWPGIFFTPFLRSDRSDGDGKATATAAIYLSCGILQRPFRASLPCPLPRLISFTPPLATDPQIFSRPSTGISSEIRAKLRDWAVWQARAGCYSQAALSSNDSKTL